MGRLFVSRKRQRSEQDLLLSSTLTTEEWKAEQQLERDAQASTTVPVKNEACALWRGRASKNLRTAKCYIVTSTATAWPGSRLNYRGYAHLREQVDS